GQFEAWAQKGALPSDTVIKIKKQHAKHGTGLPKKVAPVKSVAKKVEAPKVETEVKTDDK
ncbi:hypothetical protein K9K77_02425, partial [Candidatus Babeliales bacterium]|nr:hypothetical protein [Candidatus Babeliales bacterium]